MTIKTPPGSWQPSLDEDGPAFRAITRALEADVRSGRLRPGDRLPPHRELAETLGVNVGTVSRAYGEARRLGLIRGEVGRGTFVTAPASPTLVPQAAGAAGALVDLSVNLPLSTPAPDLAAALRALADAPDLAEATSYRDPAGSPRARAAGARWLARIGVERAADEVVCCAGAQHAIQVALASVVGPGEPVLAEALTYPGFVAAARMLGLRVRPVAVDAGGLVPEALEAACASERPRLLYCMPRLQNPTTAQLLAARRERIAEIARAYDLVVVEDDIQGDGVADPAAPLAAFAPERVLTIGGVSKVLAPGLRIAFLGAARARIARLAELVWSSVWMASPLGAELAAGWIEDGTAWRIAGERRHEMELRGRVAAEVLSGLVFHTRPGAYQVWLELPAVAGRCEGSAGWDAATFTEHLRGRGIAVSPANAFLAAEGPAPAAVRVSLSAARSLVELRRALEGVAALARERPRAVGVRL